MCEDLSDAELQRLAHVIYCDIARQLGRDARAMIDVDHNLREVIVDGSVDLVKVAAAVAKRCCVRPSDVEMITDVATAEISVPDMTPA